MNWQSKHRASEEAAAAAHSARLSGDSSGARSFFESAASLEREALADLAAEDKPRTFGIIGVSAVALSYKAGELRAAEQLAHSLLSRPELPEFAAHQLRELLQTVWNEQTLKATGVTIPRQSRGHSMLEPLKAAGHLPSVGASRWLKAIVAARSFELPHARLGSCRRCHYRSSCTGARGVTFIGTSPEIPPSAIRTSGNVKLLLPPRQSRGASLGS